MNLAVEETIARSFSAGPMAQPTVRLWTNPKAVVVGRFQEVRSEVDLAQCHLRDVQVARRFTGGGTVFHDKDTLNLTLTGPRPESSIMEFQENNLRLVLEALNNLGLRCSASPPNSILIDGRKVCGAACAVGMHFGLWHCSILVDTDTQLLELTLAPSKSRTKSRFVRSRWQPVTTLAIALRKRISVDEVALSIERSVEASLGHELEANGLTREEEEYSQALHAQKYSSNEWNLKGNGGFVWSKERGRANHTTIAV